MAKANKKAVVAVDLPECPVCLETMSAPIFQCQSGHSLCNTCTTSLMPPLCPICRMSMTQMRNFQLEEIVMKAKIPCPNKSSGCVYSMIALEMEDHLKECIFREMECPLGEVFGRCSWQGQLKEMMDHFKERHAEHCSVNSDADIVLDNISGKDDDRHFFLTAQGKMLFIVTMKIDTLQKMAYWTVQHIGGKVVARQHIYEIHVTSNLDARRKVVFTEHCFNDAIKADEVFRQGKCAVLPLEVLSHFIKDKKLNFRFFIKRIPPNQPKGPKGDNKGDGPSNSPNGPGPKGPGPKPKEKNGPPKGQNGPPKGQTGPQKGQNAPGKGQKQGKAQS